MADFGKNYPLDGMVGAILRTAALGAMAFLLGTYASYIASTEGISMRFGGYRAWVFFIPAFTAVFSGLFALRATYWIVVGITAGERQLMVWRRNLLMELLFTGLGGFCLLLGNIPGMAWDLGPLGMIVVITGLGFLGNPQAVLIDGASKRVVESGLFYASAIPFGAAALRPLCIVSRPSGFESWYLGLGAMALSPPISREEAERVAVYARERTGFGSPHGEDAQIMKRALEVLGDGLAQANALEGLPPAKATPSPASHVHVRQHRLLQPNVTFQAVNDAMYAAGFKSVLPISEVEPEAAIWERATVPKSYETPRVTYEMDAKLGAKRLVIEWLAARDVPTLPTIAPESIDLSPTLPVEVLGRNLAQLAWLTASTPGWSGLAGAVETVRPHPSPLAPMKWESPRQEMVCYSDPSPISLERVAALKSAPDPSIASAALNLEKRWLAQRAMNRR